MSEEQVPGEGQPQAEATPESVQEKPSGYSAIAQAMKEFKAVNSTEIAQKRALEDASQKAKKLQALQDLAANPETQWQVLDYLGINPEGLKPGQADPASALKSEVELLKEELNALKGISRESARERMLNETKSAVYGYLEGNEEFPAINGYGQEAKDLVFQTMRASFESDGEIKSEEQAAREVEQQLREHYEKLSRVFGGKPLTPKPTLTNSSAAAPSANMTLADLEANGQHDMSRELFAEMLHQALQEE